MPSETLLERLENTEEAPAYVHPNMGKRYADSVSDLIASLNDPEHRPESAEIVRTLIDQIILTPNEDRTSLVVDLCGDLAGILQMSEIKKNNRSLTPRDRLEVSKRKEIEQIESVIDHSVTDTELGFTPSKVKLVAGADRDLNLLSGSVCKVKLVAGVGFVSVKHHTLKYQCLNKKSSVPLLSQVYHHTARSTAYAGSA